jgi:hypothetical protein
MCGSRRPSRFKFGPLRMKTGFFTRLTGLFRGRALYDAAVAGDKRRPFGPTAISRETAAER